MEGKLWGERKTSEGGFANHRRLRSSFLHVRLLSRSTPDGGPSSRPARNRGKQARQGDRPSVFVRQRLAHTLTHNCIILRIIKKRVRKKTIVHEDTLEPHRIVAGNVMAQGAAGRDQTFRVRFGSYVLPPPENVSGLMFVVSSTVFRAEISAFFAVESPSLPPHFLIAFEG